LHHTGIRRNEQGYIDLMKTLHLMRGLGAAALPLLLLPQLAQAQETAPSKCAYAEIAQLPLRYAGTALQPAVAGVIDGVPAVMLVDTGSPGNYLTMTATLKRDLPLRVTLSTVRGVSGKSRLYTTRLKDFSVGPISSPGRKELPVIKSMASTPGFDAIIGAPFLLQADLEVDLRAKQIKFFRGQDCERTPLNYWEEPATEVPFAEKRGQSPNPHFKVLVNGKEVDAMIDTGASNTAMSLEAATRIGIDVKAPDARLLGEDSGIGTKRIARWSVPVKSVQIGDETIGNVHLGVIDSQFEHTPDLLLGQDFLRTHHVLFAMSQQKLYIAYVGGDIFGRPAGIDPWIRAEAEAGNADAQFVLAQAYLHGNGVARDPLQYRTWLDKAAAQDHPHAKLILGRQYQVEGKIGQAVPLLRAALDQMPDDRIAALWLYNGRVANGEGELAKRELEHAFKAQDYEDWPAPVARFYLGQESAAQVLAEAGKEGGDARHQTCQATSLLADWYEARGDKAQASPLRADLHSHCGAPATAQNAAKP
jgi:clan AA aspartic protease (TIGR02281 family)